MIFHLACLVDQEVQVGEEPQMEVGEEVALPFQEVEGGVVLLPYQVEGVGEVVHPYPVVEVGAVQSLSLEEGEVEGAQHLLQEGEEVGVDQLLELEVCTCQVQQVEWEVYSQLELHHPYCK